MAAAASTSAATELEQEIYGKWRKPFDRTPLSKDLSRLASVTRVVWEDDGSEVVPPPAWLAVLDEDGGGEGTADGASEGDVSGLSGTAEAVLRVVAALAHALGDERTGDGLVSSDPDTSFAATVGAASGGSEKSAVLAFLHGVGGDESPTVRVLATVNQGFVAPVSIEYQLKLGLSHMSSDIRGSWSVEIAVARDATRVSVTHRKAEMGVGVPFDMTWALTVDLVAPFAAQDETLERVHLTIDTLNVRGVGAAAAAHIGGALGAYLTGDGKAACQMEQLQGGDDQGTVSLMNAGLEAIPVIVFEHPDAPTRVTELWLSMNALTTPAVDHRLASLGNLRVLHLQSNHLDAIPPPVFELSALEQLHVGNNNITEIPEDIASLTNLVSFSASYNQIRTIPMALCTLSRLAELFVSNNELEYVPTDLQFLQQLTKLSIHNNPGFPETLQGATTEEIIAFLRSSG